MRTSILPRAGFFSPTTLFEMYSPFVFAFLAFPNPPVAPANTRPTQSVAHATLLQEEVNGLATGEAEHFSRQTHDHPRAWHRITVNDPISVDLPTDVAAQETASGGAYIKCLPDTRQSHNDPLVVGENFSNEPGVMAVISYRIHFNQSGRYYAWLRTYSRNTEDNGVHIGLNGTWPASGRSWQTTQKQQWRWDCRQRTPEVHTGVPMQLFLDVPHSGEHELQISMREDGMEIDKWLLTLDPHYRPDGQGPVPHRHTGPRTPQFTQ